MHYAIIILLLIAFFKLFSRNPQKVEEGRSCLVTFAIFLGFALLIGCIANIFRDEEKPGDEVRVEATPAPAAAPALRDLLSQAMDDFESSPRSNTAAEGNTEAPCPEPAASEGGWDISFRPETLEGSLDELKRLAHEQEDAAALYRVGLCYAKGIGCARNELQAVSCYYQPAAERGYAPAMHRLAEYFSRKLGGAYDAGRARSWYEKSLPLLRAAAEAQDAWAQLELGYCYYNGYGVKVDMNEAARWFSAAASRGIPRARYALACCYQVGMGRLPNTTHAARLFKLAAEQGDLPAMYELGICYLEGQGLVRDEAEAARWFRKAAERDEASSMYLLAACYEHGKGLARDADEAARWYAKAQQQLETLSAHDAARERRRIGDAYYNGYVFPADYERAAEYYRSAAEGGDSAAMVLLGGCYLCEGKLHNTEEALRLLRQAGEVGGPEGLASQMICCLYAEDMEGCARYVHLIAEQGYSLVQYVTAVFNHHGYGVPQDHAEAARWYRILAEQGLAVAQYHLAGLYQQGLGVAKDEAQADDWYRRSAAQGYEPACSALQAQPGSPSVLP